MAGSEPPRSGADAIPQVPSRMDGDAMLARSLSFQQATAGRRGMAVYGTGKPGVGAEHMAKVRKREAAEAKRREAAGGN